MDQAKRVRKRGLLVVWSHQQCGLFACLTDGPEGGGGGGGGGGERTRKQASSSLSFDTLSLYKVGYK